MGAVILAAFRLAGMRGRVGGRRRAENDADAGRPIRRMALDCNPPRWNSKVGSFTGQQAPVELRKRLVEEICVPDASGDEGGQPRPQIGDAPLQRLLSGLPGPVRRGFQKLRQPGAKWVRIPLGIVLVCGGVVGFLPILGFWMIPLGLLLLAQDIPVLERPTMRGLAAVQRWWDRRRT